MNRDLDSRLILCRRGAVRRANALWARTSFARPCGEPRNVAVCCIATIVFNLSYDGLEAYLKSRTFGAQHLQSERLPGHRVIASGMAEQERLSTRSPIVLDVEARICQHFTITDWKGSDSRGFNGLLAICHGSVRLQGRKCIPPGPAARPWQTKRPASSLLHGTCCVRVRREAIRRGNSPAPHIRTIRMNRWMNIT